MFSQWLAGGNTYSYPFEPERFDAHGLKNGKVYINNNLITNSFTVINSINNGLDITAKVLNSYTVIPFFDNGHIHWPTDDRIPTEAHHHHAFQDLTIPNAAHNNVLGWMVAVADNTIKDDCQIEVDDFRVYGFIGFDSVLLCEHDFSSFDAINDGGLYNRYPYFPAGYNDPDPMPANVDAGIMTFYPGDEPNKVWHWWTPRYYSNTGFDFDHYKAVCYLRIEGHAAVQTGIDFRTPNEGIGELGVSDWYFENNGQWQEVVFDTREIISKVSVNKPLNNSITVVHNRNHNRMTLNYQNLPPDDYVLEIFSVHGASLWRESLHIEKSSGKYSFSVKMNEGVCLFSLKSDSETRSGKIQIQYQE